MQSEGNKEKKERGRVSKRKRRLRWYRMKQWETLISWLFQHHHQALKRSCMAQRHCQIQNFANNIRTWASFFSHILVLLRRNANVTVNLIHHMFLTLLLGRSLPLNFHVFFFLPHMPKKVNPNCYGKPNPPNRLGKALIGRTSPTGLNCISPIKFEKPMDRLNKHKSSKSAPVRTQLMRPNSTILRVCSYFHRKIYVSFSKI